MSHQSVHVLAVLALLNLSVLTAHATTNDLPASAAGPIGSATQPGFLVRTVQAPESVAVANNYVRAVQQLNGTLLDAEGDPVPNEAVPGSNPDGRHSVETVDFEIEGMPVEILDDQGVLVAVFDSALFPGIPGGGGHTTRFAVEVVALLELSEGSHTFGVSVNTDRTDVNDDDSYQVFVGENPRDFFGLKVGEFQRTTPPFESNTRNENFFTVIAPQAGLYPFRLVYWQTGRGGNLQWYSVLPEFGERILINDPIDPRAINAFQVSSIPRVDSPYVAEVSPLPGSAGNSPDAPVEVVLFDGSVALDDGSLQLYLNDALLTVADTDREERRYRATYETDPNRSNPANQMRLEYAAMDGTRYTNEWEFGITVSDDTSVPVTGQWDFLNGDLAATVGQPLTYFGGPDGLTAQNTQFGSTVSFGIPDINGQPAMVMSVPGDVDRRIGYVMDHGIAPNGGGTRVNQYTLIMDLLVAPNASGAAALLQISSTDNTDDGDLFWQNNNFGQGEGGYNGRGTFTAGEWHRVVAAYDMAATPPVVTKYVDGIKQDDWTANHSLDAPRRALLPTAILFADGDEDERHAMFVNSIQIRSGKLSDAQIVALGGPSADGIPTATPRSSVTGQWDFLFGDLGATVGKDLRYLDGPTGLTQTKTLFGTTTELGVADVAGEPAFVMQVPGDLDRNIGYVMEHLIPPNGGGTRVNQYTLIMDVMVSSTGLGAAAILQISSTDNTDDGDLFWQNNNFGQGEGGYEGTAIFTPDEWHRVVAAYDMASTPPVVVKYVDGIFQHNWTMNQSLDHPRRALLPTAILFADGDQDERREWWVNSIQIREGALPNEEIEALGGPSAAGIPVTSLIDPPALPPTLTIARAGDQVTLSWPGEAQGFTLESAAFLPTEVWTPVPGVVNNNVTITAEAEAQYFRLRQ
jgi:hypothetical protein